MFKNQNKYIFTTIISIMILFSCFAMIDSSNASENVTINSTTDGGIKQVINQDYETIYLENGLYKGANNTNLTISRNLTIEGKGDNVIIDAQGNSGIFYTSGTGCTVTLINIKFINSRSPSINGDIVRAITNYGGVNVINCSFTGFSNYYGAGGAIANYGGMSVTNCNFIDNGVTTAYSSRGGAIYNIGSISVINCNFTKNSVNSISNSSTGGGNAYSYGGAIFNDNGGRMNIIDCNFINNTAISSYSIVTGWDNVFSYGGAIFNNGTMNITNCYFTNNKANSSNRGHGEAYSYGGAIFNNRTMNISGSGFYDNAVIGGSYTTEGNAIYNMGNMISNGNYGSSSINGGGNVSYNTFNTNLVINTSVSSNKITITVTATANGARIQNRVIYFYTNGNLVGNATTNNNGIATYNYTVLTSGNHIIKAELLQFTSVGYTYLTSNSTKTVNIIITNLTINTSVIHDEIVITVTATANGVGIQGRIIYFYVLYELVGNATTNNNGVVTYNYALSGFVGTFPIKVELLQYIDGESIYLAFNSTERVNVTLIENTTNNTENNTNNSTNPNGNNSNNVTNNDPIVKKNTQIIMNDFKGTYNKIITISATLKSGNNPISNKLVNFYVNNKYVGQARTNSQGIAIFNYKVTSTGTLSLKGMFNEDSAYISSFKTSKLTVLQLSEIKITNKATVKKRTAKITTTVANLGYNKGTFKLTYKLAKGLTYKKPKVSTGKISYNKKTRTLTWTISNLKVHKTKSATLTWTLNAKKGKYAMKPSLVKNNSIRLLSNNNLSFKVK